MNSDYDTQRPMLSPEWIKKTLRRETRLYYSTAYLNDILYFHYKGFNKIENMEQFTCLKCIYFEGNGFSKLEGLSECKELRCLYIQENCIYKLENLEELIELRNLNISDNWIETIEGFDNNLQLSSLQIKRNRLGTNGLTDVEYLTKMEALTCLDLSDNKIDCEDSEDLIKILEVMKNLKVLYLFGNPIVKKIRNYRKTLIARLPLLKFLDDRPVFEEDRIFAEGFYTGGIEGEREARRLWKEKVEQERVDNFRAFREMVNAPIRKPKQDDESSVDSKIDSEKAKNLDTYYSSSLQDSSKNENSELDQSGSKKDHSDSSVLKGSDTINRTTPNDTDNSSVSAQSKDETNSQDSKSERIISEDKSESRSAKSETEESKENNEKRELNSEQQTIKKTDECNYFEDFENHLSELD